MTSRFTVLGMETFGDHSLKQENVFKVTPKAACSATLCFQGYTTLIFFSFSSYSLFGNQENQVKEKN